MTVDPKQEEMGMLTQSEAGPEALDCQGSQQAGQSGGFIGRGERALALDLPVWRFIPQFPAERGVVCRVEFTGMPVDVSPTHLKEARHGFA
jgi:hypothetical protein